MRIYLAVIFLWFGGWVSGQPYGNLRHRAIVPPADTVVMDTLSVVPASLIVRGRNGNIIPDSCWGVDWAEGRLWFNAPLADSVLFLTYRVFPFALGSEWSRPYPRPLEGSRPVAFQPEVSPDGWDNAALRGLDTRGNIARGIVVGNNQDAVVNSNLNLQIQGQLSENLTLEAVLTDNNLPVQAEGNTSRLQEFDQVYIRLYNRRVEVVAGDYAASGNNGYFMRCNKKVQGGSILVQADTSRKGGARWHNQVGFSVAKGKFNRVAISGQEGNQGPYRLTGAENEQYIVVLSGSEKVFVDGQLVTRGEENDYTIDYNTAELIFTPRQLITKDKRIIIEFEYSDKNYTRFLIFNQASFAGKRGNAFVNFYSESDNKNQSVQQTLNDAQKQVLAAAGDNRLAMVYPTGDSTGWEPDRVLYRQDEWVSGTDTIPYYIYSVNPDSAFYSVSFSVVGQGRGHYIQVPSSANGRVFEFVPPVGGIRQGNFEPVSVLIAPRRQQMVTVGGTYKPGSGFEVSPEVAFSMVDENRFSGLDAHDDQGIATSLAMVKPFTFGDSLKLLVTSADYKYTGKYFRGIERYRDTEFERDWNLTDSLPASDEHLMTAGFNYLWRAFQVDFRQKNLWRTGLYQGSQEVLRMSFVRKKLEVVAAGSYLKTSTGKIDTRFVRANGGISRLVGPVKPGLRFETENNRWSHNRESLLPGSAQFLWWEAYITTPDTSVNSFRLAYRRRFDRLPDSLFGRMEPVSLAHDITLAAAVRSLRLQTFDLSFTYRKVDNRGMVLPVAIEDQVLGRIQHTWRLPGSGIQLSTLYETGSGLESKKDVLYLKVPAGQGTYKWDETTDYNRNGVPDLDEFELARFPDEANYIRILSPSLSFQRVYQTRFNESVMLYGARLFRGKSALARFGARWGNSLMYQVQNKNTLHELGPSLNPFHNYAPDQLVTQAILFRNNLSFNKNNPLWGADYIYQQNSDIQNLYSSTDKRRGFSHGGKVRWNFFRQFTLFEEVEAGNRNFETDMSLTRNYYLDYLKNLVKVENALGLNTSLALEYEYLQQQNNDTTKDKPEGSESHLIGLDLRTGQAQKGLVQMKVNYILIQYQGDANSPLRYEMLQAFNPGKNASWELNFTRILRYGIELGVNYSGRYLPERPVVHTGTMQLRMVF